MARVGTLALCAMLFVVAKAEGVQLRWESGGTDIAIVAATRCTLVVQADSVEQTLPREWRLLWVADTTSIGIVAADSSTACQAEVAQVFRIEPPSTSEDSLGNVTTARFCSDGEGAALVATYFVDIPGGACGKLKAVAVDPADSSNVVQSQEVTFNGGIAGDYPAAILATRTSHQSLTFEVTAVGVGLSETEGVSLVAEDGSWQLPLTVSARTEGEITATASIASLVPACRLQANLEGGATAEALVSSDPPAPSPEVDLGCERHYAESDSIVPRNACLVAGGWTANGWRAFHLFYTRENTGLSSDNTKKNIGHATSNDLYEWDMPPDQSAVRVRPDRFDALHVYAPMVVLKGLTYYMFYGGEAEDHVQRIGVATSTDLATWAQGDSVIYADGLRRQGALWVDPTPDGYGRQPQLGDPFVMEDPEVAGGWLLFFTTVTNRFPQSDKVVGVVRSNGSIENWRQPAALWNTHHEWPNEIRKKATTTDSAYVVESPHAFRRDGKWWLFYVANQDTNWVQSNEASPADTVQADWSAPQKLGELVPPAQGNQFYYWHQSEHVQIPRVTGDTTTILFACENPYDGVPPYWVSFTKMAPAYPPRLFSMSCDSMALGVEEPTPLAKKIGLFLNGASPARSELRLRIELPSAMRVHLAVYDVTGRRLATLTDKALGAGATNVVWDGRDRTGTAVRSGIYFARLTTASTRVTVRVPLIR
jgi:hypothetical protein